MTPYRFSTVLYIAGILNNFASLVGPSDIQIPGTHTDQENNSILPQCYEFGVFLLIHSQPELVVLPDAFSEISDRCVDLPERPEERIFRTFSERMIVRNRSEETAFGSTITK